MPDEPKTTSKAARLANEWAAALARQDQSPSLQNQVAALLAEAKVCEYQKQPGLARKLKAKAAALIRKS